MCNRLLEFVLLVVYTCLVNRVNHVSAYATCRCKNGHVSVCLGCKNEHVSDERELRTHQLQSSRLGLARLRVLLVRVVQVDGRRRRLGRYRRRRRRRRRWLLSACGRTEIIDKRATCAHMNCWCFWQILGQLA